MQEWCPCGSEQSYESCCAPFHKKTATPATALQLMRARYCAYVLGVIDFVWDTHHPLKRGDLDREAMEEWSDESHWEGLLIKEVIAGQEGDEEGDVTFVASYVDYKGKEVAHFEKAHFVKENGVWFYAEGELLKTKPIMREETKVGRNDPCPCGSGKKYKKCCA